MTPRSPRDSRDLTEAVGRLLIIGFEGTEFSELESLIADIRPAGLIFFKRNYPAETGGPPALRQLIVQAQDLAESALGRRLLVAIDHEGGPVQRLPRPYTALPPAQEMSGRLDQARELYARAGRELAATGFNFNLAPVLDVASPLSTVLGARCFSDEPARAAEYGRAVMENYGACGVLTCGKHFPGLGSALIDPHHELPVIEADPRRLREADMAPFRALAAEGLPAIMSTHALYPALDEAHPATFSSRIVGMLKEETGFAGAAVTDDLEMGAVVKNYPLGEAAVSAVLAGHDLALVCRRAAYIRDSAEALASALWSGRLSEARLLDAHERSGRLGRRLESIRPDQARLDEWFLEIGNSDV